MTPRSACRLVVLLSTALAVEAGGGVPSAAGQAGGEPRARALHEKLDHRTIRTYEPAARAIDFADVDYDLLSATVFHETNRRRIQGGRSVLGFRPELREAARIQAQAMARTGRVSHRQRTEDLRTTRDRLAHVGLQPAFGAENVAMTFGIRYDAGKPVFRREQDGRLAFSYRPEGDPIPPHTYLSFAEQLLDEWMASSGHRANILHVEPAQLGTGHQHARNELGMDVFYSVQVFFRELTARPGSKAKGR